MAMTKDSFISTNTANYLASYSGGKTPEEIAEEILGMINNDFDMYNAAAAKGRKLKCMDKLLPVQIADIILALHNVAAIKIADTEDGYILAMYQEDGENEGIYVTDEKLFSNLARQYSYTLTDKEFKEVMRNLKDKAPVVERCNDRDLIAVNNGIFNYKTKQLMPFSPDYVFMAKSAIDYNQNAQNVVIHNDDDGTDWDVESWMNELDDDPEVVKVLWETAGALLRPNVKWNKAAWFYSETGNNGKGTLCTMFRNLIGKRSSCSIKLADMGKDFTLAPLLHSSAVIVDENDVGTYIDKAANLKAIITGDTVQINRKFKEMIDFQFHGFMVQCLNEMPKVRDKSNSFFRRQLFIPFTKCFEGAERKYIKDDYLKRKDVLEYVMFKVLNMNYYELSVPEKCKDALAEYKEFNDPVRQFMSDIMSQLQWDFVPSQFLYDLYKAWYNKNVSDNQTYSKQVFWKAFLAILTEKNSVYADEWSYNKGQDRPKNMMDKPEWLIEQYDLKDWYNPVYKGADKAKRCCTPIKDRYTGYILRK